MRLLLNTGSSQNRIFIDKNSHLRAVICRYMSEYLSRICSPYIEDWREEGLIIINKGKNIGLHKDEIVDILRDSGLKAEIILAIASVIMENNKKIDENISSVIDLKSKGRI